MPRSLSVRVLPWILLVAWASSDADANVRANPPQPTGFTAIHRSGQTFLTWTERGDLTGETYRVYRSDQPIDLISLGTASLLLEVGEDSGAFHADRYQPNQMGNWQPRYLSRFVIQDGGAPLGASKGLLVWTLDSSDFSGGTSGNGYYAITTVDDLGIENVLDFTPGNTLGPVNESVGEPLPVEAFVTPDGLARIFIQYLDLRSCNPTFAAPNPFNSYYGLSPTARGVADSLQYAFAYTVALPDPALCPGGVPFELPVSLVLHGWSDNSTAPNTFPASLCAIEIRPIDVGDSWWFGYARDHDYRTGSPVPGSATIHNDTEARILRMVYDLGRHGVLGPRMDWDRLYLIGHSMGASGCLALAQRYAHLFAAAYCSEPIGNFRTSGNGGGTNWKPDVSIKWGTLGLNLPVAIDAPAGWASALQADNGTGVWDWQNHQENFALRRSQLMAPIGLAFGRNDMVAEWTTQGLPTPGFVNASDQCWGLTITNDGHVFQNFKGLPPLLADRPGEGPFYGMRVRLDETVPGLANASDNLPIPPPTTGGYHQSLEWSSSWKRWDGIPIDRSGLWGISLRSLSGAAQGVDVTVRRPQRFRVAGTGSRYVWENRRVNDNVLIAAGLVQVDADGLLTVPSFFVSPAGNRLRIRPRAEIGFAR
ncbi:MAG: hypothetical protein RL885_13855 [Planctomycetota bacterium]